ncbi:MAG: phage portal protein [Chitinophagaceae bacterium]|nr:phage portal protein [Chitinophagaceae bacterium]
MTREKLQELLEGDFDEAVTAISLKPEPKTKDPLKEYNVHEHDVFDPVKRPNVKRKKKTGEALADREVNRIGIAMQKMIVGRAAAFLCANPIVYKAAPKNPAEEKMWAAFKKVNENNKLDYKNQNILEKRMSETEVAEIWYLQDIDEDDDYWTGTEIKAKQKPRLFISAVSLLDKMYPVWDGQDSLVAFARQWKEKDDDGKDVDHFDVYTDDFVYEGTKNGSTWEVNKVENPVKKVLAIYHWQEDVEWANAKPQISRLEFLGSNLGDSNDKTMSPIFFVEGKLDSLPDGTAGRVINGPAGSKAYYVTSDNAPESLKMEVDMHERNMYITTDTVRLDTEVLQGIGQTSGVALELLFMPAHLKASKHAGTFGECVQRRVNLIKKMIATIDPSVKEGISLTITPTFDFFLPKDVTGIVNYLANATMGDKPSLSQETAVNILQGAIGGDGKAELEKIKSEAAEEETKLDVELGK